MSKNNLVDKIKEGVSVQEMEDFVRKYTVEVFTVLAIFIGAISSIYDFFTGPGLTIFFTALGTIVSVIFPVSSGRKLKRFYSLVLKQDKTTEIIIGCVKIVIALFIPFAYFGLLGLLAGTSYHYYIRHSQIIEENAMHHSSGGSRRGEEHE